MVGLVGGVIGGFFTWIVTWVVSETVLSAIWPEFGTHQAAFQSAIENGSPFTPDATILLIHCVLASIASVVSGFVAALIGGENKRAPLFLGFLLLAVGILKAVMSWQLVPVWYHIIFTGILIPMAVLGGKMRSALKQPISEFE